MGALLRVARLWRGERAWLAGGALVAVLSAASAVLLLAIAAGLAARDAGAPLLAAIGIAALPLVVRALGVARVVLRYAERLATHAATFRALAALRIWFFRGLSVRLAGGLGLRRAGDVLARLVADVDSLDGLYLRIFIPFIAGLLVLPVIAWLIGAEAPGLAALIVALFLLSAVALPAGAAGAALRGSRDLAESGARLRTSVLDAVSGLREVRAAGAEGAVRRRVAAQEETLAGTQRGVASRAALAGAARLLCGQAALRVVLAWPGLTPGQAILAAFLVVGGFDVVAGLPRAGSGTGSGPSSSTA